MVVRLSHTVHDFNQQTAFIKLTDRTATANIPVTITNDVTATTANKPVTTATDGTKTTVNIPVTTAIDRPATTTAIEPATTETDGPATTDRTATTATDGQESLHHNTQQACCLQTLFIKRLRSLQPYTPDTGLHQIPLLNLLIQCICAYCQTDYIVKQ